MLGCATAYLTGSPWLGVLAGGCAGVLLGTMHGLLCSLKRVNDIAIARISSGRSLLVTAYSVGSAASADARNRAIADVGRIIANAWF